MKKEENNSNKKYSRRKFFRNAGIGTLSLAGMPLIARGTPYEVPEDLRNANFFPAGATILFQGDSITDAGRNKNQQFPNHGNSFGTGYAMLIAARLLGEMPAKGLTIYNRGISGNKVYQLADRWQEDCLDLEPDILSILIGVNDYWHRRNGNYDGTPGIYENDYRKLLERTRKALPEIRLVICEPFILPGTSAVDESWEEPFRPYQKIAQKLAKEFEAVWVPYQKAFSTAAKKAPATYWTGDGVHPSMAGAQLMANTWLNNLPEGPSRKPGATSPKNLL
ncbi:MAG: SGNH/GDSL hydrolase family protein [Bacteroidales bacterium]|nr:SGNH/GDSL hydrolase family protein [Bacteroidales bacterium]